LSDKGNKFAFLFKEKSPLRGVSKKFMAENRIEKIKKQLHPFDEKFKKRLEKYFADGDYREITPEDIERLKWYGIFYRKATPGLFMLRIRVPAGVLNYKQALKLAELSQKYARGVIEITSRQQVQIRYIELKHLKEILEELNSVGLTTLQTGLDNVRNVVCDPLSGLAIDSEIDTVPLAYEMTNAILGKKEFADLPRKFNPAILGSKRDSINALYNDFVLYLAEKNGVKGFNLYIGGKIGSGGPEKAIDVDIFVSPQEVVEIFKAVLEIYRDFGNRENRSKNRIYFLLKDWGIEKFRREIEKRLGKSLPSGGRVLVQSKGERKGIVPQKEDGLYAVLFAVPSGKISSEDFKGLALLSKNYGNGELRLTTYQNVYLVNVKENKIRQLLMEPLYEKFEKSGGDWIINTVACAGSDTCHFGVIENKSDAVRVAQYLKERINLDIPIRIHWSACVKGCGQHGSADIGLVGTKIKEDGRVVLAVEVFVGGNHSVPAKKVGKVPLKGLEYRLEKLLRFYMNHRQRGESFFHFVHRVGVKKLKKFFGGRKTPALKH